MRGLDFPCASFRALLTVRVSLFAQPRSVAITVDDLPYAGGALAAANASVASSAAELANRKIAGRISRPSRSCNWLCEPEVRRGAG